MNYSFMVFKKLKIDYKDADIIWFFYFQFVYLFLEYKSIFSLKKESNEEKSRKHNYHFIFS